MSRINVYIYLEKHIANCDEMCLEHCLAMRVSGVDGVTSVYLSCALRGCRSGCYCYRSETMAGNSGFQNFKYII